MVAVAADTPERLAKFREKRAPAFTFVSDPDLHFATVLDVPVMRAHPMSRKYPQGGFLQPSLFLWRPDGTLAYEWRQTPKLLNLFGASGRPGPDDVLRIAREQLAG